MWCNGQVKWLLDTSLVDDVLAVLGAENARDSARHASEVLVSVARSTLSPLQAAMGEPQFLATLLRRAFDVDSPSSVQVGPLACWCVALHPLYRYVLWLADGRPC